MTWFLVALVLAVVQTGSGAPLTSSGFFFNLSRFLLPLSLGFLVSGTALPAPLGFPAGKFAKLGDPLEPPGICGFGSALVGSIWLFFLIGLKVVMEFCAVKIEGVTGCLDLPPSSGPLGVVKG